MIWRLSYLGGVVVLALALMFAVGTTSALAAPATAPVQHGVAAPLAQDDDDDDDDDDDGGAAPTLPNTGVAEYLPLALLGAGVLLLGGGLIVRRRIA